MQSNTISLWALAASVLIPLSVLGLAAPISPGNGGFYVLFSQDDGSWSEPINIGEGINSTWNENRPFVTLDGRYFFFTSNRVLSDPAFQELSPGDRPGKGSRDIHWVDAKIIDRLRPTR